MNKQDKHLCGMVFLALLISGDNGSNNNDTNEYTELEVTNPGIRGEFSSWF